MTQTNTPAEPMTLRVGDTVLVDHGSDGQGKLVRCKETVETVRLVYLDGTVCVGNGDVYTVEPSPRAGAKWRTKQPRKDTRQMRNM